MDNQWPPFKECIQYKIGLLGPYLQNFSWEHNDGDETQYEYQTGDEDEYQSSYKVEIDSSRNIIIVSDSSDEITDDDVEDDSSHEVEIDSPHKVEIDSSHKVEDDSSYDFPDNVEEDSPESDDVEDGSIDDSSDKYRRYYAARRELLRRRRSHRKFRFSYKPSTLRKFVKQVRESRGYDVNVEGLPNFMLNPFIRYEDSNKEWANLGIEVAIKEINSKTGKVYKHVETLVYMVAARNRVLLLTFTAKAVDDKEVEVETFLAAVHAPGRFVENYKVLECLLKPEGPAPWSYVKRPLGYY